MVIRVPDQRTARGGYAALDDRMLVLDFQAGDIEAFVEIHRRYGGLARHVCQRFLPNPADADEAMQETMIRVFQGLYRFNGRYALRAWIARIAKNVSLDVLRGRARRPTEDGPADDLIPDPHDEADMIVERMVQRDTVLEVMAMLPEAHRRALVMREIDGASHRDIARELEITPPQAKALLHRARGAFRKRWLEKVTGEGGLRAIAFLPLLWLARVGGGVRRLGERAGQAVGHATQAAQAAPEALTSAVATSAPATAGVAERVLAAGMTLLVAGGVTVGAAKIVQDREARPAEVAAAAAVVTDVVQPETPSAQSDEGDTSRRDEPRPLPEEVRIGPVVVEPSPTTEPSPSVDPSPSPDPSPTEEPTPEPGPTEETPPPPPAPAWGGSVSIAWTSGDSCGCAAGPSLDASSGSGQLTDTTSLEVQQSFSGAALDAEGDSAWAMTGELQASLGARDGSIDLILRLEKEGTVSVFRGTIGSASTVNGVPGDGSPAAYTFYGSYSLQGGDPAGSPIPVSGTLAVAVSVWSDGISVYSLDVLMGP